MIFGTVEDAVFRRALITCGKKAFCLSDQLAIPEKLISRCRACRAIRASVGVSGFSELELQSHMISKLHGLETVTRSFGFVCLRDIILRALVSAIALHKTGFHLTQTFFQPLYLGLATSLLGFVILFPSRRFLVFH